MFPSVRLAQNLLETGGVIHPWYNLGGIKVGSGKPNEWWDGSSVKKGTWEVVNGQRVDTSANFRAYKSVYHFYKDQDLLFAASRYARVRAAKTPEEQADMLYVCGYATDPAYARKLKDLIRAYDLKKYDREAEKMLQQLQATINEQRDQIARLERRVKQLEVQESMSVPIWAEEAVEAAVKKGLVANPDGASYDFYRFVTVLHRAGII